MEISPTPFKSTLILFSTPHIFFFYLCPEEPYSASIRRKLGMKPLFFHIGLTAKREVSRWYFPGLKILTSVARQDLRSQAYHLKKLKAPKE